MIIMWFVNKFMDTCKEIAQTDPLEVFVDGLILSAACGIVIWLSM